MSVPIYQDRSLIFRRCAETTKANPLLTGREDWLFVSQAFASCVMGTAMVRS
jgi:hypothetical protein